MLIFHQAADLSAYLQNARLQGQSIGFVPTMGALHAGHMALIQQAQTELSLVVCSIFVNPTQFNDAGDLAAYPRTLPQDIALLEAQKCAVLFIPSVQEIYPATQEMPVYSFGKLENLYEGKFRPGHFQGVGQVVARLLAITRPQRLYMGQKDFQQCKVVANLLTQIPVEDRTELVICPTLRAENGLALSSRNARLNPEALQAAAALYQGILWCREHYKQQTPDELRRLAWQKLAEHPLIKPEYIDFVVPETLEAVQNWNNQPQVWVILAAWVDGVRLIDNDYLFM